MGRAMRWIKDLFGLRADTRKRQESSNRQNDSVADARGGGVLCNDPRAILPNLLPAETARQQSFFSESGNDDQHAITVAAARVDSRAAASVVRLTSGNGGARERSAAAALRIQTVFRGYLARKALRALRSLVKLQALVRGYLVRKQAVATLHSMQALFRARAMVCSGRARGITAGGESSCRSCLPRKSYERFDEARSEHTASFNRRRLSSFLDCPQSNVITTEETPKIVEVDAGGNANNITRPKSKCGGPADGHSGDRFAPNYPTVLSSSLPIRMITTRVTGTPRDPSEWGLMCDECHFSTAQNTPRFAGAHNRFPITPSRNACGGLLGDSDFSVRRSYKGDIPGYMASTESFSAKSRSRSAPKQRLGRRATLNELMESRSSFSGVSMQKSCSREAESEWDCRQRKW